MSQTGTDQFVCEGCGRSYRWKPELAGRKVKCKCGQVMIAPKALAPVAVSVPAEAEVDEDDLYTIAGDKPKPKARHKQMLPEGTEHCPACDAFLVIGAKICVQCGFDLVTGKAPPKPTAVVDDGTTAFKDDPPVATVAKPAAVAAPTLAYKAAPLKKEIESVIEGSPLKDFWAPIALILIGTVVEYAALMMVEKGASFVGVSILVGISMVFNVVIMLLGILVAAKVADMGFGHPIQAILKLGAIAICTPAVQHMIGALTGVGLVGAGISLIIYFALFMWLFELDMGEAQIVVGIVWILNNLAWVFLFGMLVAATGL